MSSESTPKKRGRPKKQKIEEEAQLVQKPDSPDVVPPTLPKKSAILAVQSPTEQLPKKTAILAVQSPTEQPKKKPTIVSVGSTTVRLPKKTPVVSVELSPKNSTQIRVAWPGEPPRPEGAKFPIPLPSNKHQYRGVGIVFAKLVDVDWKNFQGQLVLVRRPEIAPIPCLFLPMPLSLLRQLDLEQPYWWIVYPNMHHGVFQLQLSGVRSKLINPDVEDVEEPDPYFDGWFSFRGSVSVQEKDYLLVKIKRNKKRSKPLRPSVVRYPARFRLIAPIPEKLQGWFCDFTVFLRADGLKIRKVLKIKKIAKPNILKPKKKNKPPTPETSSPTQPPET